MVTIVHLSDLHFGRASAQLRDALRDSLAAMAPRLVIVSGDMTQRATSRQYQAASRFIAALQLPCLVIAGNHDIPAYNLKRRLFTPWSNWRRHLATPLEPVYDRPGLLVVGVNTARRFGSLLDWSRGRINVLQVRRVVSLLGEGADGQLRIIVAHHPFWLPPTRRHRGRVGGGGAALRSFAAAGADLILGGHIHMPYDRVEHGMLICHAGTAISSRIDRGQRNSFKVIRGNRNHLAVELFEWYGDGFKRCGRRRYRRCSGRWEEETS